MKNALRTIILTATLLAAAASATAPQRANAQSYQIDCAILLCLSGGWPASIPCARARAEFIRRITPWPVEPPLQIWRCPMGAAYTVDPDTLTSERFYEILFDHDQTTPLQSRPIYDAGKPVMGTGSRYRTSNSLTLAIQSTNPDEFALWYVQDRADIDISGPEFDFVRSIRVFDATFVHQSEGREDCHRSASVRMGSYGTQGDFRWSASSVPALPEAHVGTEGYGSDCPSVSHRSVFVEWRDYLGNYGYEQVNY